MEFSKRQLNALEKKNITNLSQLRRWYPLRYLDYSKETGAHPEITGDAVIIGELTRCILDRSPATNVSYISVSVKDRLSNESIRGFIFGQYHNYEKYRAMLGKQVLYCGKLKFDSRFHDHWSMASVDLLTDDIEGNMRIVPVYSKIKGISDEKFDELLTYALCQFEEDTISSADLSAMKLPEINNALTFVMRPADMKQVAMGKNRLVFDDLFYMASSAVLADRESTEKGPEIYKDDITLKKVQMLPFTLTKDQRKVFEAVHAYMISGKHLNALVQGDVGCGKTIIAFLTLLLVAENGYQGLLMAPTKVLAEQHYAKLVDFLKETGIECCLVTNQLKGSEKKKLAARIKDGEPLVVVGTHSVLSDDFTFPKLGLMVVDEEHKFGVEQREKITDRQRAVDCISMSATPIPRTLAKAIYGNSTAIYSIHTMPAGRLPIITCYDNGRKVANAVRWTVEQGHQVYIVAPMIYEASEDSPMGQILSVEAIEAMYRKEFPAYSIAVLSGRTGAEETEDILKSFSENKINILISTTVVEVGIDVANATMMVIYNAERFGLASMHQLRGRVGRSSLQSYCILVSKENNERIRAMCETTDGFEIAEKDLEFRRSGSLFGLEQSGRNHFVEEMIRFPKFYQRALDLANRYPTGKLKAHVRRIEHADNPRKSLI